MLLYLQRGETIRISQLMLKGLIWSCSLCLLSLWSQEQGFHEMCSFLQSELSRIFCGSKPVCCFHETLSVLQQRLCQSRAFPHSPPFLGWPCYMHRLIWFSPCNMLIRNWHITKERTKAHQKQRQTKASLLSGPRIVLYSVRFGLLRTC